MRAPFVSSSGSVDACELLLLTLQGDDGARGLGEAVALGVGAQEVRAALEDCRALLTQSDGVERQALLEECSRLAVLPQALAAIDLALWDLAGRRAGEPVWRLLGATGAEPVECNATVAAPDRASAAREAALARTAGFRCLKLKVGIGDDAGRLAAVRAAAGPQVAIRLDANGSWSPEEALAALRALEPGGIELCEEPASGIEAIEQTWTVSEVPIAIDETAARPGALDRKICDAVCLKIARCGGITGLLDASRLARSAGYEIYLASMLDGPIGIAAAVHAAIALSPDRPCGLATLALFDGRPDVLPVQGGRVAVPVGPGLGDGLAGWYAAT